MCVHSKNFSMYVPFMIARGCVNDVSVVRIYVSFIKCGVSEMDLMGDRLILMGIGGGV